MAFQGELELSSDRKFAFEVILRVVDEIGEPFAFEAHVPSEVDLTLSLAFLELLVILRLQVDEGTEDLIVMLSVSVLQQEFLGLLRYERGRSKVVKIRLRVLFLQFFERTNLVHGDGQRVDHFAWVGLLNQPRHDHAFLNQRRPLVLVPDHVTEGAQTQTRRPTGYYDLAWLYPLHRHHPKQENVLVPTHITLEVRVAMLRFRMQTYVFVLRFYQVSYDVRAALKRPTTVAEPTIAAAAFNY